MADAPLSAQSVRGWIGRRYRLTVCSECGLNHPFQCEHMQAADRDATAPQVYTSIEVVPADGPDRLREVLQDVQAVAGRFMGRGHAGFEYEEISEALALALQELSVIHRRCGSALDQKDAT